MKYPIAIEPGDETHAFGVVVPDLPGCFSAGDTLDEAMNNAKEAVELWLDSALDDNETIPSPRPVGKHWDNPEFSGWIWAVVDVDMATFSDKVERVNITLPARILRRIDAAAMAAGESRSGYIARCALR